MVTATTKLYLVRHAKAGSRSHWAGADEQRPLSGAGRRQAEGLPDLLSDPAPTRVVTSPYVRCVQTVTPLAERLGIPVHTDDALAEGTALRDALRLVEKVSDETTVLCSHGDVVGELLSHFSREGVLVGEPHMAKGSTWVLDAAYGTVVAAAYIPPPGEK
jgi:broad specificity phosphatase PhoE